MPPDAVVGDLDGRSWAIVGDPEAPGRRAELERGLRGGRGGLGPAVPLARAAESARRAALALELADESAGSSSQTIACSTWCCAATSRLAADLSARALAPLDELPAGQRARLVETLAAWLDAHGEARPAAERLHVHVQTVRYRLDRLRELLGDALDEPERRLELQLALRIRVTADAGTGDGPSGSAFPVFLYPYRALQRAFARARARLVFFLRAVVTQRR